MWLLWLKIESTLFFVANSEDKQTEKLHRPNKVQMLCLKNSNYWIILYWIYYKLWECMRSTTFVWWNCARSLWWNTFSEESTSNCWIIRFKKGYCSNWDYTFYILVQHIKSRRKYKMRTIFKQIDTTIITAILLLLLLRIQNVIKRKNKIFYILKIHFIITIHNFFYLLINFSFYRVAYSDI